MKDIVSDKNGLLSVAVIEIIKLFGNVQKCIFSDYLFFFSLFETEIPEVTEMLQTRLDSLKKHLKKMTFKGAEILLQKLEGKQSHGMTSRKEISL